MSNEKFNTLLACNPIHNASVDAGRCVLTFGTDASRDDEPEDQVGTLRAISFNVSASGVPSGYAYLGFATGGRVTGNTSVAYDTFNSRWYLAFVTPGIDCVYRTTMLGGTSNWGTSTCVYSTGTQLLQMNPNVAVDPTLNRVSILFNAANP